MRCFISRKKKQSEKTALHALPCLAFLAGAAFCSACEAAHLLKGFYDTLRAQNKNCMGRNTEKKEGKKALC